MNPEDQKPDNQQERIEIGHLIIKVKEGETVTIGPSISMRINRIVGMKVYVSIMAPVKSKINRAVKS